MHLDDIKAFVETSKRLLRAISRRQSLLAAQVTKVKAEGRKFDLQDLETVIELNSFYLEELDRERMDSAN